jgi:uncharacterized protein
MWRAARPRGARRDGRRRGGNGPVQVAVAISPAHRIHATIAAVPTRGELHAQRARLRQRARAGDARAALQLGRSLERDAPRDHAAARRAYQRAAEGGLADAQHALGELLRDGRGGPKDLRGAARAFEAAAKQGHPAAAAALAAALFHGEGLPRDRPAAVRLWRRAASAGLAGAMLELAECLRHGHGGPRDPAAALRWARRAAARGHPGAASFVGLAYWFGRCGAPRDRARAAPFLLAAARKGDEAARALAGSLRSRGGPAPAGRAAQPRAGAGAARTPRRG